MPHPIHLQHLLCVLRGHNPDTAALSPQTRALHAKEFCEDLNKTDDAAISYEENAELLEAQHNLKELEAKLMQSESEPTVASNDASKASQGSAVLDANNGTARVESGESRVPSLRRRRCAAWLAVGPAGGCRGEFGAIGRLRPQPPSRFAPGPHGQVHPFIHHAAGCSLRATNRCPQARTTSARPRPGPRRVGAAAGRAGEARSGSRRKSN